MSVRKRRWTTRKGEAKQAWQASYMDGAGNRRFKQFARKKEAEAFELHARQEVSVGIHTPDQKSITVATAADLWLQSVRALDREPTTIAAYDQHVRLHIVPRCGALKLSQLTAPKVRALLDSWQRDLSRPMTVRVLRTFKAIINEAMERGDVAQNVAQGVKMKKEVRRRPPAAIPSKKALRGYLENASQADDTRSGAFIPLAIFSGLRASEARGLAWRAVDLRNGRITIEQRADSKGVLGPPKSESSYRTIPLPQSVVQALKAWKLACPPNAANLVFPNEKGRPLSHRVLIKNIVEPVTGVTTLHTFRHAAASLWIDQRLNPKRVQYLMGHSSIQVTFDTYGHLFEQADRDAEDANAIEAALFNDAT